MIVCPNCRYTNQDTATYCSGCGTVLPRLNSVPSNLQAPTVPTPAGYQSPFVPPMIPQRAFGGTRAGFIAENQAQIPVVQPAPPVYCLVCGNLLSATNTRRACPKCRVPRGGIVDPNDVTCSRALVYSGHATPIRAVYPFQSRSSRSGETGTESNTSRRNWNSSVGIVGGIALALLAAIILWIWMH